MISFADISRALLLLFAANGAAWLSARIPGIRRAELPLDFGAIAADGERLLGSHKTWRGLIAGILAGALVASLTGVHPAVGAGVGALSLVGDALSSGVKRRMRFLPGTGAPGIDQLPEALIPIMLFNVKLRLGAVEIAVVAGLFLLANLAATHVVKVWR